MCLRLLLFVVMCVGVCGCARYARVCACLIVCLIARVCDFVCLFL